MSRSVTSKFLICSRFKSSFLALKSLVMKSARLSLERMNLNRNCGYVRCSFNPQRDNLEIDLDTGFENNRNSALLSVKHRISEFPMSLEKFSKAPRIANSSFSAIGSLASLSEIVLDQNATM